MKYDMLDYAKGSLIGIGQVLVGHPFDTMKVIIQSNGNTNINPHQYLRGIKYPMILSTFSNAGLFGIYTTCNKNGYSHFTSGFIAGGIMSIFMNPFEFWKVQAQNNPTVYKLNKQKDILTKFKLSYCGMKYMTPRESIGNGIYFNTYAILTNKHDSVNITKFTNTVFSPFIAGGLSGTASWLCTYALDTAKTRKQANPTWTFEQCASGSVYKGLFVCLCRAFLANGVSFVLYDLLYDN